MAHHWQIADREYARHEARRGRRHAFGRLDPAATALVVVDMVPFFVAGNPRCLDIAPSINRLATALRATGGIVAWVLPSSEDSHPDLSREFYGEAVAETYRTSGGEGPLPDRLWPELDHAAGDLFVEKASASAFFPGYCRLPELLTERAVRTVIVTGTVTNVCCESTARDARTLGFRVIMAADANAAGSDAAHNASLETIYRSFGDVRSTEEILALIAHSHSKAGQKKAPPPRGLLPTSTNARNPRASRRPTA
jgi:nicotinamidase-related amidase